MYNFRTDLALERRDLYKRANNIENEVDGIETEEENIYAMLFGLKECPYHMYTFFIMENKEDNPMIKSSLKQNQILSDSISFI